MDAEASQRSSETGPEIFIGLVGAAGTDLKVVVDILKSELKELNYKTHTIRMSSLLCALDRYKTSLGKIKNVPEDIRIEAHMDAGDHLRQQSSDDALASLSIIDIRTIRKSEHSKAKKQRDDSALSDQPLERTAYIFDSLKHPDEAKFLRSVYRKSFILLSVYSPRSDRVNFLAEKIAKSNQSTNPNKFREKSEKLIERDSKSHGQNVRDLFPLADVFIVSNHKEKMRSDLNRFLQIWFRHPYKTPKKDEYGIFHAKATSLRSSDLSRQVGAAITSPDGEVLSVGCNEVPKSGGGSIWDGEIDDFRDFQLGEDASATMKSEIVTEVIGLLKNNKWLNGKLSKTPIDDLINMALYEQNAILKDSRISSIIEYGRIVHAEMAAIMDAARRGISLKDSVLYCTTFPCHMCARHIIAAGIKRVVFIEPYPKSMAQRLYKDSLSVDFEGKDPKKVHFEPFVGISPNRYLEFFTMPKRKDDKGNTLQWSKSNAFPLSENDNESKGHPKINFDLATKPYIEIEKHIATALKNNAEDYGLKITNQKFAWKFNRRDQ